MSKYRRGIRDKILLLHRVGMKPKDIAKATDTAPQYVYFTLGSARKRNQAAKELAFLQDAIKILEARA
jgi:hypothetical protein